MSASLPNPSPIGRSSTRPVRAVGDPVSEAVVQFSAAVAEKWNRGGNAEDQLRGPLEVLLKKLAASVGVRAVPYGEVQLRDLRARPDYAVDVGSNRSRGTRVGYIELKAPGAQIPPKWKPEKRDRIQWEKLQSLPNVLYTNGTDWASFSYGNLIRSAHLDGSVTDPDNNLHSNPDFISLVNGFLLWEPESPRSLGELINIVAGLCRLLREEVDSILGDPSKGPGFEDLSLLASDWRDLLFPDLNDKDFGNAYAQTVTFAILLAGRNKIPVSTSTLHDIARLLGKKHSLMGRALSVLTDTEAADQLRTIETIRSVVGGVNWVTISDGTADLHSDLYERFLAVYDPILRRQSGSYYTPRDVAAFMVDRVDEVIRSRMQQPWGLAGDKVIVVDPAMGTGTFLVEVLRSVAETVDSRQGPGARPARLRELFERRLVGFEIQAAPYAVTELRLHEALEKRFDTEVPRTEARFLTDALENPCEHQQRLTAAHKVIGQERQAANQVKREARVMVVIGNPPHVENTRGKAPWIEERRTIPHQTGQVADRPSLDEFRSPGLGRYESDLYGLPWCFWRWAIWKAFEAHDDSPSGVVAFLTPASFLRGRSFAGMRQYLRRICDEGWIIELSPEGNRPPQSTRVFGADVGRQLCVAIFARYGRGNPGQPAQVYIRSLKGTRQEKLAQLRDIALSSPGWHLARSAWETPFAPTASEEWESSLPLTDIFPWNSRGVTTGRTWAYAPDPQVLRRRWSTLLRGDQDERRSLFVESRDRSIDRQVAPLPGFPAAQSTIAHEMGPPNEPIQIAYRSFDRQWVIPDSRLMVMPRPPLWAARSAPQVFVTEQSNHAINSGPALTFTDLIPDIHHFNVRSGRVYPLYRDPARTDGNVAPGLLTYLEEQLQLHVTTEDLAAYVAGLAAHNGYTYRYRDNLKTPGVRIPFTRTKELWLETVKIGRRLIWLHTFGERYVAPGEGRPRGAEHFLDICRSRVLAPIPDTPHRMPDSIDYDRPSETLLIGSTGQISPVSEQIYEYDVGGMKVLRHWFDYRSRNPRHKRRSSPLDDINCRTWTPAMTNDLLTLITILGECLALEPAQSDLLEAIAAAPRITATELAASGILPVPPIYPGLQVFPRIEIHCYSS
ncbi:MAG: hypothetical protein QG622_1170 [Actinomycetota bacterium]|nr:hypothetical protein [Actinomycetota bacterium]